MQQTALTPLASALVITQAIACSPSAPPDARRDAADAPPAAEFLLAAGDSTYWVTTGSGRTRVRGAPLTLARFDGRFYEVYVGDDDRSFYDALFVGQRIFRRDLLSGDSVQVYGDRVVAAAARRYAAAHPDQQPLAENEEESERPRLSVIAEVDLVASHGPYLTYEVRTEREVTGELESYDARRGVVDLRAGRRVGVADVVGSRTGAALLAEGRRRFAAAVDSLRAARGERALRARRILRHIVFDPASFGIEDVDRAPAIAFLAPGQGPEAGGYTLPLSPIVVEPPPGWWAGLRGTLPATASDSSDSYVVRWARAGAEVQARYDSVRADYTLFLRAPRPGGGGSAEWTLGRVHGPARQLYWLDSPPMDSAMRRALVRAFDESALYSEDARTASWGRGTLRRRPRASAVGCRAWRSSACGLATPRLVSDVARPLLATPHTSHPARSQ